MASEFFGGLAPAYWERGLSALPVKPATKQPSIKEWTSYQSNLPSQSRREEWLSRYGDHGIGVNTGTEILSGELLVGIDVDDDRLVRVVQGPLDGTRCAKRGAKGATLFVRMSKMEKFKSTTLKGSEDLGNIDVLAGGRFTVLPPTVHPNTGQPYEWLGQSLLEVDYGELPLIDKRLLDLIGRAIGSKNAPVLVSGTGTHDAGVAFVAELVSGGAEDAEIEAMVRGLLPENYDGNSLEELPGWIKSAREKGFDQRGMAQPYDPGEIGPIPLGYAKDGSFALRDQIRGLILLHSANQLLNFQTLIGLAPTEFWAEQYPAKDRPFLPMAAGEAVLQACREKGPFDPAVVRGRGVWRENDQTIVNLGGEVPPDLNHTYLAFSRINVPTHSEVDATGLRDLIAQFPFKYPLDAELLFGWLCLAPLCGALEWRPHAFLFGPPNSGKTTLHNLAANILKPMVISADGQSTEAGIRQSLGPDALPVVIDEFETDSHQSRLQGIMRLARSASSAESPLLRGTPEGKALQFSIKAMMLLSAVNVTGMSPADQSRFILAELKAHDSDPETARAIAQGSVQFSALGPNWCGYVIGLAPAVLAGIDVFKAEMPHVDSRLRQTMASLLAGRFAALNRRAPSPFEAKVDLETFGETILSHQRDQDRDNALECLNYLLSHVVRDGDGVEQTIGRWLADELTRLQGGDRRNSSAASKIILDQHQIRFFVGRGQDGFLVRNGAPPIDAIFRGTKWADGAWMRALGQLKGSFKLDAPQRFANLPSKHRSIGLPLAFVPEADGADDPEEF